MFRRSAMEKKKPIIELELYLIRHGQSQGNVGYDKDELTPQEQHDPILTEIGVRQAQLAGMHLSGIDFDRVYSDVCSGVITATRGWELLGISKSSWYRRVREKQRS